MQHLDNVDDADMNEADNEDHSESEQELDSESDHDSEDDEEKNEDSKNDEGEEGELEFEEENGEADDSNAKQQRFISIVFLNLYSQFVRTFRLLLLCRFVVKSFYLSFFLKLKPKKKLSSLFEWW